MPQATRDIKRRIKSIGNTRKITKAMELVAAAKMRRATESVLGSRSYARLAWSLVKKMLEKSDPSLHPLMKPRPEIKKIGLLLITSNRGLCGGFNNQIIQRTVSYIKTGLESNAEVEIITLGKKGRDFIKKRSYNLSADFEKLDIAPDLTRIRPIVKLLIQDYLEGKFDKVAIAYTDFISALAQKPRILEILPLSKDADSDLGAVTKDGDEKEAVEEKIEDLSQTEYLFEPTAKQVLEDLLPRMIEVQVYQSILESNASEHSARMVAMRNATDSAKEMIDDLTLEFNKARQAAITAELADISGGSAAVS